MILDCIGFERALEALVEGRLAPPESLAARKHVEHCEPCRELLALAEGGSSRSIDLVPAVLTRTSGPGCERARERFGELVDGELAGLDGALVMSHLSGCAECERVHAVVVALAQDLPLLAELDPGEEFTRVVLARTRATRRARDRWARWASAWQQILLRPRFALEAAYVLTLVVVVVFGAPGDLLAGLSRQVREAAAVELPVRIEGTIRETGVRLRSGAQDAWRESGAPVTDDARRSLAQVAAYTGERIDAVKRLVGTLTARAASEPANDDERSAPGGDPQNGEE